MLIFLNLGTRGELLKTRLLVSSTYGTKVLNNEDQLDGIFKEWKNHLNEEYVMFTEDLINDGKSNRMKTFFGRFLNMKFKTLKFRAGLVS